ncbi:ATP-binding protein [Gracilinema caldarium]|uniref:ATP-binding protein n=1 Tax=Gracilinema caldarium TaxID=215591 RepID=UPI0026EB56DA|nr:ATP-binding protein [Gracilinema caldarium]
MVTIEQLSRWLISIEGLTLFGNIRKHWTIHKFINLCETLLGIEIEQSPVISLAQQRNLARAWAEFAEALFLDIDPKHPFIDWETHIVTLVLGDENPFTLALEHNTPDKLPQAMLALAKSDLDRLKELASIDTNLLAETVSDLINIVHEAALSHVAIISEPADMNNSDRNFRAVSNPHHFWQQLLVPTQPWSASIDAFGQWIHTHGAGILSQHHAFIWKHQHKISKSLMAEDYLSPVINADTVSLNDLSGYDEQRSVVLENTRRFVEGKAVNNLLLYGDRGTGKSATVKAVCRAFADRGLKLIEVRKRDLMHFETIAEIISSRGLKFVLFIDDLSFEETDDTFTGLKALLEGGLERRPSNMVIYATSNRRHLVKEHFADRPTTAMAAEAQATGDVRAFDTMQEQLSLADRFGVTVVFTTPTQEEYLAIAEAIAARRGLLPQGDLARQQFRQNALRWERWFNGRSPRTAQQFVDWLSGGKGFPWE